MAEGRARRAVEAARRDIDAGRLWKARDRLDGAVRTSPHDAELLLLLGEVLYEMRDLPRAGAAWILTQRDDEAARAAVAALYERYGCDEKQIRRAIPYKQPIEGYPEAIQDRLMALGVVGGSAPRAQNAPASEGSVTHWAIGAIVVVICLAMLVGIAWIWIVGLGDVVKSMDDEIRGRANFIGAVGALILDVAVLAILFAIPFAGVASIQARRRRNRELAIGSGAPDRTTAIQTGRLEPSPTRCFGWGLLGLFVPPVGAVALLYSIDAIRTIRLSGGRLSGTGWAVVGAALGIIGLLECLALVLLLLGVVPIHQPGAV